MVTIVFVILESSALQAVVLWTYVEWLLSLIFKSITIKKLKIHIQISSAYCDIFPFDFLSDAKAARRSKWLDEIIISLVSHVFVQLYCYIVQ